MTITPLLSTTSRPTSRLGADASRLDARGAVGTSALSATAAHSEGVLDAVEQHRPRAPLACELTTPASAVRGRPDVERGEVNLERSRARWTAAGTTGAGARPTRV